MDGFKRLVFRLTPIIMLICFICIGITHVFTRPNQTQPLTYLTYQTITVDDRGTIETTDDITINNYTFDFETYRSNISTDLLVESLQNVLDLTAYTNTLANFSLLWEDGYQVGDILKTILNGVILIVNTIFVIINIFIMPLRILTAILLVALSLVGININRTEGIIIPFLNIIVSKATIPLINRTDETTAEIYNNLTNTTWTFNNQPEIPQNTFIYLDTNLTFTSNNQQFTKITISNAKIGVVNNPLYNQYTPTITYNNTEVYTDGNWINNNYKTIFINNVTNNNVNTTLSIWLTRLATQQTTQPIDTNIYQWYETAITHYETNNVQTWYVVANIESNNELFTGFVLSIDSRDWIIAYATNEGTIQRVCENGQWTDIYYRQFTILNTEPLPTIYQNYLTTLLNNNFITIYNQ